MSDNLFHSTTPIRSFRKTAPRINPGIAQMHKGKGMEQVGQAIFDVGEQVHQVNVARQVASALAEYKMNAVKFMAEMQNADPSKVDFDEAFAQFQSSQGGLSAGVSRDASNIISNKIKGYGASTYGDVKRTELINTAGMIKAEAPEILDNLSREAAAAEVSGNEARAAQAEEDYNAYLAGVAPGLRPQDLIRLKNAWGDAKEIHTKNAQKDKILATLHVDPDLAEKMVDGSKLNERDKFTMRRTIAAKKGSTVRKKSVARTAKKADEADSIMDTWIQTGTVATLDGADPDTVDVSNQLKMREANGTQDETLDEAVYDELRLKLDNVEDITTDEMFQASTVLSTAQLADLRKEEKQNDQLGDQRDLAYNITQSAIGKFDKIKETLLEMKFDNEETLPVLMRELDEKQTTIVKDIKNRLIKGDDWVKIKKDIVDTFEQTTKDVLDKGHLIPGRGYIKTYSKRIQRGTGEDPEADRFQAVMHLMAHGKYEEEIEAAVSAGWFSEAKLEVNQDVRSRDPYIFGSDSNPNNPTFNGKHAVPYALDGKFYAAPIVEGQSESDAILSAIDSGNAKEFKTKSGAETYTGKALR